MPSPPPTTPDRPPALALDPRTYARGLGCVHCGLCLPACPTYTQNGHEADSPRGRISLMLGLADGKIEPTASVRRHLDLCLDCRACETACPSGVVYHELIEETRGKLAATQPLSRQDRLLRWIFFHIFTHRRRLRAAVLPARLLQRIGLYSLLRKSGAFRLLPEKFRKMERMFPAARRPALHVAPLPPAGTQPAPTVNPPPQPTARSAGEQTVGFFQGCIGAVLFDRINRQGGDLLRASGAVVVDPRRQVCCGAIHHHNGGHAQAQRLARQNIDAFSPADGRPPDALVATVAGCGAMLREYGHLLRDDPHYAKRAADFGGRVRDITEILDARALPPPRWGIHETAVYHDACHLAHAQGVTAAPRRLLASIPGLTLVPLAESDMCCGAAGTYNLTEPRMSADLADRKLQHIAASGARICVTGNAGCSMQIASEADARHQPLTVLHPVELLHLSIFGP